MRPHHFIHVSGIVAIVAVAASASFAYVDVTTQAAAVVPSEPPVIEGAVAEDATLVEERTPEPVEEPISVPKLGLPITSAFDRVTKKTFALEIHPETSPVQNDRFNGFHVGVDFETFENEQEIDIPVFAVCDGPLLLKGFAKGYGGYALQSCEIDGETVIVLYGHMHLERIEAETKQMLTRGQTVGILGKGYSKETDGVRKHLHLGIHKGTEIDIRGYVQETDEIDQWIDPLPLMK
jgi:murein DD-endopeptidase MepM/ murein hydrolase activator NlpD